MPTIGVQPGVMTTVQIAFILDSTIEAFDATAQHNFTTQLANLLVLLGNNGILPADISLSISPASIAVTASIRVQGTGANLVAMIAQLPVSFLTTYLGVTITSVSVVAAPPSLPPPGAPSSPTSLPTALARSPPPPPESIAAPSPALPLDGTVEHALTSVGESEDGAPMMQIAIVLGAAALLILALALLVHACVRARAKQRRAALIRRYPAASLAALDTVQWHDPVHKRLSPRPTGTTVHTTFVNLGSIARPGSPDAERKSKGEPVVATPGALPPRTNALERARRARTLPSQPAAAVEPRPPDSAPTPAAADSPPAMPTVPPLPPLPPPYAGERRDSELSSPSGRLSEGAPSPRTSGSLSSLFWQQKVLYGDADLSPEMVEQLAIDPTSPRTPASTNTTTVTAPPKTRRRPSFGRFSLRRSRNRPPANRALDLNVASVTSAPRTADGDDDDGTASATSASASSSAAENRDADEMIEKEAQELAEALLAIAEAEAAEEAAEAARESRVDEDGVQMHSFSPRGRVNAQREEEDAEEEGRIRI